MQKSCWVQEKPPLSKHSYVREKEWGYRGLQCMRLYLARARPSTIQNRYMVHNSSDHERRGSKRTRQLLDSIKTRLLIRSNFSYYSHLVVSLFTRTYPSILLKGTARVVIGFLFRRFAILSTR